MKMLEKQTRAIAAQAESMMLKQLEEVITIRIAPLIKEKCREVLREEGILK